MLSGKVSKTDITQSTGTSTTSVMSQKAVSDALSTADEEDITRNIDGKLQFKDKEYGDGMGYVILRKNKSFAEQVTKENTIYEIRYEFSLNGEKVKIPTNCELKFNGGKIIDGILNCNGASISGQGKLFHHNVILEGVSDVHAEWLGIVPEIECNFFDWWAKQHLSIKFREGSYYLSLADCKLSSNTALIGMPGFDKTKLYLTPIKEYKYLFGIGYYCTIKDLSIYVKPTSIAKKDILRIDNAFWSEGNEATSSNYGYEISNLFIDCGWYDTSINPTAYLDNGGTAIHIKTTQYNDFGEQNKVFALSWEQKMSNINLKNCKIGIHIEAKQDNNFGKVWQNCLAFNNLTIAAVYGVYIERENTSDSLGHMFVNYLFQALCIGDDKATSFGFYGSAMKKDSVCNYISWDNQYLGKINGTMYVNNADVSGSSSINGIPENYMLGFIKLDNNLPINIIDKSQRSYANFIHEGYLNTAGNYSKLDFSKTNHFKWLPISYNSNVFIDDSFSNNGHTHIKNINANNINVSEYTNDAEAYTTRLNSYKGNTYIAECIEPHNMTSQTALLDTIKLGENYNFSHFIMAVVNNWYGANENYIYEVTATIDMTPFASIENAMCYFSRVEGIGCEIISSHISPKSNILKVLVKVAKGSSAFISFDVRVSAFNYTDVNEIRATQVSATRSVSNIGRYIGKFENVPISTILPIGFAYWCTDKQTTEGTTNGIMIYYKGNNIWVDALGRVVV